jgi:hypothetical protein
VAPERTAPIPALQNQPEIPSRRYVKQYNDTVEANVEGTPDFVGLSLREALEKAQTLRVKLRLQGNGYVVKQSPAPGNRWNEGEVLVLSLQG